MNAAPGLLVAGPLAAVSAWALELVQHVKLGGHGVQARVGLVDLALVAALAMGVSAGAAAGHPALAALAACGAALLFAALWADAVLFRVYSIELGLEGVRSIVVPLLYRELAEVAFARRFFREQRAFATVPALVGAAYASAFLPRPGGSALAFAVGGAMLVVSLTGDRPRRLALWGAGCALLAAAPVAAGVRGASLAAGCAALVLAARGIRVDATSVLRAFFLPRAAPAPVHFAPAERDAAALELRLRPPSRSDRHGRLAGSNVVLWTFESMGRGHLRAYGGRARTPFLESLLARGAVSDHHFAPAALTNDAHVALYAADHVEARGFPPLEALAAAGYRLVYLTACATGHYGLGDLLRRAGFHAVLDQAALGGRGTGDRALLSRGLELLERELRGGPVFVHVHTSNSHIPYRIEDAASFSRHDPDDDYGRYLDSLEEADAILRAMAEAISARAGGRETLWIASADHGQAFGERGYRSHGSAVVKEQVDVPFVMDHARLGPARFAWSSHLDVLPTVLDLLGIDGGRPCRGDTLFGPRREPLVVLSAGRPARSTTSNFGLVIGDRKYMVDLVLDRCLELSWADEGRELVGAEGAYARALVAHAFARVGLR